VFKKIEKKISLKMSMKTEEITGVPQKKNMFFALLLLP